MTDKFTLISGYATIDKNPWAGIGRELTEQEYSEFLAWQDKNFKTYTLRGHWREDSVKRFADKRGLTRVNAKFY